MSASRMPTDNPRWAIATARLAVRDDFPTPPLPEAMAMIRVVLPGRLNGISLVGPCNCSLRTLRCSSLITSSSTVTSVTPGTVATAARTRSTMVSCIGHDETVRYTPTVTAPVAVISTDFTIPTSVMGRRISGSCTVARAACTASVVTVGMALPYGPMPVTPAGQAAQTANPGRCANLGRPTVWPARQSPHLPPRCPD